MTAFTGKKIVVVSYHYHTNPGYRSSLLHRYFSSKTDVASYHFLGADWDHHSKSRTPALTKGPVHLITVPGYFTNFSLWRIISQVVFSLKLFFRSELRDADLIWIYVPPSLSAVAPAVFSLFSPKAWIVDVVDLWPEALPVSGLKRKLFDLFIGSWWIGFRNLFFARATRLVSHCQYFLKQIALPEKTTRLIPMAQSSDELTVLSGERVPLSQEIRIAMLGSINHVLNCESLARLLGEISKGLGDRRLILEILGDGESKQSLLDRIQVLAPLAEVLDHGVSYDPKVKAQILSRCHFGYNGYRVSTAIGITYKSIDFASQGLAFLNSVQGDLLDLVEDQRAGFNFKEGAEQQLAGQILALSDWNFDEMSSGSRKIFEKLFRYEDFVARMDRVCAEVLVQ